jgi:hypothetical protein
MTRCVEIRILLQNGRSSLYTVFVILTIVYAYYFNSSIMLIHTYVVYDGHVIMCLASHWLINSHYITAGRRICQSESVQLTSITLSFDAVSSKNDVRFVFTSSCLQEGWRLIVVLCIFASINVQYFTVALLFSFLSCVFFFYIRSCLLRELTASKLRVMLVNWTDSLWQIVILYVETFNS